MLVFYVFFRLKVPPVSDFVVSTPTPLAIDAIIVRTTSNTRDADLAVTPMLRCDVLTGLRRRSVDEQSERVVADI